MEQTWKFFQCQLITVLILVTMICLIATPFTAAQTLDYQIDVDYYIDAIDWSPDGQLIAVSGSDGLRVYTAALQEVTHLQQTETKLSYSISWKPDSMQLATLGNGSIFIWNRNQDDTFSLAATLVLEGYLQVLVSWSPDGTKLASQDLPDVEDLRGRRTRIHIWDTSSWTIERTLPEQYSYAENILLPFALRWSADSNRIAGAGHDYVEGEIAFVSDVLTGTRIYTMPQLAPVSAMDWNDNGLLAVGSYGFVVYDTNSGQSVYTILDARWIEEFQWSPDGTKILLIDYDVAQIRDYATNQVLAILPNAYAGLTWSPAGDRIVSAGMNPSTNSRALQVWDVSNLPDLSGSPTLTPYATIQIPTPTDVPTATSQPTSLDKLAFARTFSDDSNTREQVFTANLDGSDIINFSSNTFSETGPVWSPDSQWVAFLTHHADNSRTIDRVRRDGSAAQTVLQSSGDLYFWLPEVP